MNIFKRIGLLTALSIVLLTLTYSYILQKETSSLLKNLANSANFVQLQGAVGTIDMMHEGLKGDLALLQLKKIQNQGLVLADLNDLKEHIQLIEEKISVIESIQIDENLKELIQSSIIEVRNYYKSANTFAEAIRSNRENDSIVSEFDKRFNVLEEALGALTDKMVVLSKNIEKNAEKNNKNAELFTYVLIVLGAIVSLVLYLYLAVKIPSPIIKLLDALKIIVEESISGAEQLDKTSEYLANGASKQAAAIEEMIASISEIASQIDENSLNLQASLTIGTETRISSDKSKLQVDRLRTAMTDLNESSRKMSSLTKTIDKVSFQTNLLALNASVEAARAGQAGLGFAVVADEVRQLSIRTTETSKEIEVRISESQFQIHESVDLSAEVAESLNISADQISKVEKELIVINSRFTEQKTNLKEFTSTIRSIEGTIQQTAAAAEETSSLVKEMTGQAVRIKDATFELQDVLGLDH